MLLTGFVYYRGFYDGAGLPNYITKYIKDTVPEVFSDSVPINYQTN